MRGANFVAFLTVQGFFIALVFGILKSESPEGLLYYVFLITSFFYLFSHLCVAFYFKTMALKSATFHKDVHERHLDVLIHEIKKREDFIDEIVDQSYQTEKAA